MDPRGLRNYNPGNLVRTDPRAGWLGALADRFLTDPRFEQFTAPLYGLRALAVTLRNYQERDGCRTPDDIVRRFAPAVENDTAAYVACVAQALGMASDHPVDLRDADLMAAAIKAIVKHENGWNPYSDSLIARAIEMATPDGIAPAVAPAHTPPPCDVEPADGADALNAELRQLAH